MEEEKGARDKLPKQIVSRLSIEAAFSLSIRGFKFLKVNSSHYIRTLKED